MSEKVRDFIVHTATAVENFLWKLEQKRRKGNSPFVYNNDPLSEFDYRHFTEIIKYPSKFSNDNGRWTLEMASGRGETRITTASLQNKEFDSKQPTIIYHHPFGFTGLQQDLSCSLFLNGRLREANIVLVRAQEHGTQESYKKRAFDSLLNQQLTIAGSVLMTQRIIEEMGKIPTVVLGVSMGGMGAAWHALFYEGSANLYFPLVSYPDVSAIFLGDGWEGTTDRREERKNLSPYSCAFVSNPETLRPHKDKIFPVLGTKDLLIGYEQAKRYWTQGECKTLDFNAGHFVTALHGAELKKLMLEQMRDMFKGPKRFLLK